MFHTQEEEALKPRALVVSEASKGRYDLDKPENITDLYRRFGKNSVIRSYQKPLQPGLTAFMVVFLPSTK